MPLFLNRCYVIETKTVLSNDSFINFFVKFFIYVIYLLNIIHAQIALPSFHGVQKAHTATSSSTTFTFTNCGATGRTGPTQSQVNSTYSSGNSLNGGVTINTQGIQEWTVPVTTSYTIEAYGAQGGGDYGGKGAKIVGTFSLSSGDVLKILVGQLGTDNSSNGSGRSSGGGGGSYVTKSPYNNTSSILVIAGGGGGEGVSAGCSNDNLTGVGGGTGTSGLAGKGTRCGPASLGTNGYGASRPSSCNHGCSGGAGFFGNSVAYSASTWGDVAYSFVNGGQGADQRKSDYGGDGGFGGGGAGAFGGGGGGGYSGGGTGDFTQPCRDLGGGGGGSYNSGSNQSNTADHWEGHGKVVITY